jgi:fused signal recognition particle receptor
VFRVGALITLLVFVLLGLRTILAGNPKPVRSGGIMLILLLILQISFGIINVKLGLPLWSAVAHNGFAALLMLPLIYIRFYSRYEVLEAELPVKEEAETPATEQAAVAEEIYAEPDPETLYLRLTKQLQKTRTGLGKSLVNITLGQKKIDAALLEEIEASLLMADVGIEATSDIITHLSESVDRDQLKDANALSIALKQQLVTMLEPCNKPLQIPEQKGPFVILVIGVNGVGKTTTIGKLGKRLQAQGHSVMLAAGDTFRAAAVEQLQIWGERNNIHVVAQHTGADSASVIYDGVQSAHAKGVDVLIADTAGRLHTKANLMDELKKIKRIIGKLDENAPHEVLLVLDSGTGQNALSQARLFNETVKLTGLALTKLDGTAKGGVIFALAAQFGIPIRYIGIGEGIDDLQDFHADQFVEALFVTDD